MLRIRGTRDTLLTALVAEWSARQIGLPAEREGLRELLQGGDFNPMEGHQSTRATRLC